MTLVGVGALFVRRKGAGRPAAIRCGCFLPDLTRLANANVHPTPKRAYGASVAFSQASLIKLIYKLFNLRRKVGRGGGPASVIERATQVAAGPPSYF